MKDVKNISEKQIVSIYISCCRIIICCLCTLYLLEVKANCVEYKEEYEKYIESVCKEYFVCPELVEAIIFYESSWTESVVSKNGQCVGLMQINESVHKGRMKHLAVTNLKDGEQNILVGVDYLAELFEKYEDPMLVLDAYNGNLRKESWYLSHTSSYANKVLKLSAELEEKHGKIIRGHG